MAVKNIGQWEVVGGGKTSKVKSKPAPVKNGVPTKSGSTTFAPPTLKVEELVSPLDTRFAVLDPQLRALAKKGALGIPDKPVEKPKAKPSPPKEVPKKKSSKDPSKEKEKPPKSLPEAIKQINISEFNQMVETLKARFSSSPLLWLKEISSYLNNSLAVDTDPAFSGKPQDYPSSMLPAALKEILNSTLLLCDEESLRSFYSQSMVTMPSDMNRGAHVCGTKLMFQLLSLQKPGLALLNLPGHKETLKALESRVPASLSMLWVLSQPGTKDVSVGVQVWMDVMRPLIVLKNYAPFVCQVASQLTHKLKGSSVNKDAVSISDLIGLYDLAQGSSLSSSIRKDVIQLQQALTHSMIEQNTVKMFNQFLVRLNTGGNYLDICPILVSCLKKDPSRCFAAWTKTYKSKLAASGTLLKWFVDRELKMFKECEDFQEALAHFHEVNQSLCDAGKKPEGLKSCIRGCSSLADSLVTPQPSPSRLKYFNYLLVLLIASAVYYDASHYGNGHFADGHLGQALKQYGVTDQVLLAHSRMEPHLIMVKDQLAELKMKCQPVVDNALAYTLQARDVIYEQGELHFPGMWTELDSKYRLVSSVIVENVNQLISVAGDYGRQYWQIGDDYTRQYLQLGADYARRYLQVGGDYARQYWQVGAEYGLQYWHVIGHYANQVGEVGAQYLVVAREQGAVYAQSAYESLMKIVNDDNVQLAWKYTYNAYHQVLASVGLCTH